MEGFPQNKRESGVVRVVGVGDENERKTPGVGNEEKRLLDFFKSEFEGNKLADIEKEKSAELNELIVAINQALGEFLAKYGGEGLVIPAANIHIIDWNKLSKEQEHVLREKRKESAAWYNPDLQGIVLMIDYEKEGRLNFAQALIHEMLHANSFQSYQVANLGDKGGVIELVSRKGEEGEEIIRLRSRRIGLNNRDANGSRFFNKIDEAVIEELAARFEREYFEKLPGLEEEYNAKKELFERKGWNWGSEEEKEEARKHIVSFEMKKNEDGTIVGVIGQRAYRKEREELNRLINELYEKNKSEFSSREGVFDMFASAVMTGRLIPLGELIVTTFGPGSFRELGKKTA